MVRGMTFKNIVSSTWRKKNSYKCNYQYTFVTECSIGQCLRRLYNDCNMRSSVHKFYKCHLRPVTSQGYGEVP